MSQIVGLLDLPGHVVEFLNGNDCILLTVVCTSFVDYLGGPVEVTALRADLVSFRELERSLPVASTEIDSSSSSHTPPERWHEGFWIDSDGHWHDIESEDDW